LVSHRRLSGLVSGMGLLGSAKKGGLEKARN
jgi:hypothetical protein